MNDDKRDRSIIIPLIVYSICVILAETVISYYEKLGLDSPYLGLGIYVLLILGLLIYSFFYTKKYSLLVSALVFAPLIRILSSSLLTDLHFIYRIVIINLLLIAAAYLFIKNNNMSLKDVGFCTGNVRWQLFIGLTGILLGPIEYLILGEQGVIGGILLPTFIAYSLSLLVFTGFSEELIFRGIILTTAEKVFGKNYALISVSLLFTAMHIIWTNLLDLLFVFLVAIFYGYAFQRTRSLFGISVSHGLSNIMLFLVVPVVIW